MKPPLVLVLVLLAALVAAPFPAAAQTQTPVSTPDRGEVRIGVSLGGTGFLGLIAEYRRNSWGAELGVGTITFGEVAVTVSGKHYFSGGAFRPVVGLGLWSLTAWTEDGSGSVLIVRAPLAVEWNVAGDHAAGIEVGLNRSIAVNRLDPDDDTPPNPRIIPIPGAYYRYGWRP